jgi:pimeloyl-ACP methyl ester carboxylesterase
VPIQNLFCHDAESAGEFPARERTEKRCDVNFKNYRYGKYEDFMSKGETMESKTNIKYQLAMDEPEHYLTGSVTSKDGTAIGYRQFGHGPGLVLVQGAMGTAENFAELAQALSDAFTVYVPDRRGRGLSPLPYSKDHSVRKDVEDLDALFVKTGAHYIFGLSSGAIIALQAALTLPAVRKVAVFEPALFINGLPTALLARFDREMAKDNLAAALVTAMQATQMGPPIFSVIPHGLLELLTSAAMKGQDKKAGPDDITMRILAPTLQYDFRVVSEMNGGWNDFKDIHAHILLLGGSKSPAFLSVALDALQKILPQAKRVEFPGLGHAAAWNYDKQMNPGGRPELVAQELRRFFG